MGSVANDPALFRRKAEISLKGYSPHDGFSERWLSSPQQPRHDAFMPA